MLVLGVDPGTTHSALVIYDPDISQVLVSQHTTNEELVESLKGLDFVFWWDPEIRPNPKRREGTLVLESVESFGMPVGRTTFETVFWSGRFFQAWGPGVSRRVTRREVKLHLCGQARAKDANIRQALIDRFGPGKEQAVGTKKAPGPLYGVKGHQWQALAVAVTWADQHAEELRPGVVAQF